MQKTLFTRRKTMTPEQYAEAIFAVNIRRMIRERDPKLYGPKKVKKTPKPKP